MRVPEYGWTTQKVFHLLNALVCAIRAGIFLFRDRLEGVHISIVKLLLLDMPGTQDTRRKRAHPLNTGKANTALWGRERCMWKLMHGNPTQRVPACYMSSVSQTCDCTLSSVKREGCMGIRACSLGMVARKVEVSLFVVVTAGEHGYASIRCGRAWVPKHSPLPAPLLRQPRIRGACPGMHATHACPSWGSAVSPLSMPCMPFLAPCVQACCSLRHTHCWYCSGLRSTTRHAACPRARCAPSSSASTSPSTASRCAWVGARMNVRACVRMRAHLPRRDLTCHACPASHGFLTGSSLLLRDWGTPPVCAIRSAPALTLGCGAAWAVEVLGVVSVPMQPASVTVNRRERGLAGTSCLAAHRVP